MSTTPLQSASQVQIFRLAGEPAFVADGIVSRALVQASGSKVVLFHFAAGQELTEHTSTQTAWICILSGACEFSLAGVPHRVTAGDCLYLPPHLPHAVRATQACSLALHLVAPPKPAGPAPA